MIQKPVFKSHFRVEVLDSERAVLLLSENGHIPLEVDRFCRIARLIDGRNSADDIVDNVAGEMAAAEAYFTLDLLEKKGYIVESSCSAVPPARAAFWEMLDINPQLAENRLGENTVSVRAIGVRDFGSSTTRTFSSVLAEMNIQMSVDGMFTVVFTDDYLSEDLRAFNIAARSSGRSWLLAKPFGAVIWIGPVFRPSDTACWECLAHRLTTNRQMETLVDSRIGRVGGSSPIASAGLSSVFDIGLHLAAIETARAITRGDQHQSDLELATFNVFTLESRIHKVVGRPQCSQCGSFAPQSDHRPWLGTVGQQPSRFLDDGGQRTVPPEQTFAQYEHHISPITGAVNHLRRVSAVGDPYIHVYHSNYNSAVGRDNLLQLRAGLRQKAGGKGTTDMQARTGALCEALERYSGAYQGDEVKIRTSYKALGGDAIHPNACMLFSDQQFKNRRAWNARRGSTVQCVPEPLRDDAEIDWTPVWSMSEKTPKYLPTSYCYYQNSHSQRVYCWADSNGSASGNTLEEAILQGFLELVERDSVSLWWYNRAQRPEVDLDSFDEPYIQGLRRHYQTIERELWVLDLTSDLGVPAFAAVSRRTDRPREHIMFGFGAHLDPRIGVLRALTELNQFLVALSPSAPYSPDSEHDSERWATSDPDLASWLKYAALADQPYLMPSQVPPLRRWDCRNNWSNDISENVLRCQAIVEQAGMEMLVLEQTRADIGLPVAKVFVPGLRHFWMRFGPGRLYDVPVALGWRAEQSTPDQLNPIPMFL